MPQKAKRATNWENCTPWWNVGEEATLDHLMKQLEVQDRLDAAIDRCIKRLLLVRGVKSMSIGSTSAPPQSLPSPSKAA
jgi:hypothetical protein